MPRDEPAMGILHVPKCAGTALRDALRSQSDCYVGPLYYDAAHFGNDDMATRVPPLHRSTIATAGDLRREVLRNRLLMGHYALSSLVQAGCRQIALVVREPRTRILSLYRYWRAQDEAERSAWGPWGSEVVQLAQAPLDHFLTSPMAARVVDNAIARQVLGSSACRSRSCRDATEAYRSARANLALVEWSVRSGAFLERLFQVLGRVPPSLPIANVSAPPDDEQIVDELVMQRLNELTRGDRELLRWLGEDGLLDIRDDSDLEAEFTKTAQRLGFRIVTAAGP